MFCQTQFGLTDDKMEKLGMTVFINGMTMERLMPNGQRNVRQSFHDNLMFYRRDQSDINQENI